MEKYDPKRRIYRPEDVLTPRMVQLRSGIREAIATEGIDASVEEKLAEIAEKVRKEL